MQLSLPISSPRQRKSPGKNGTHIRYADDYDDASKKYTKKNGHGVLKEVKSLHFLIVAFCIVAAIGITYYKLLPAKEIEVSIILLTYNKDKKLADLLPSVLFQRPFNFEIILVDNGCFDATQKVLNEYLFNQNVVPYKFLQLCHNPGYAAGNNEGVKLASPTSTHLLFLNDDIVMSRSSFIHNLLELQKATETSSATVCKLLNAKGDELIEAGSIIWEDSSAAGFGRGRKDIDAPEFSYPRPVDYGSGACLLIKKDVFNDYGGFDGENFPNYYEDTDLQLHVQHNLGSEVWFQPKSVALHAEHGSFGNEKSERMMQEGAIRFAKKWGSFLKGNHVKPPFQLDELEKGKEFFRASDLRARDRDKAKILYIDDKTPNHAKGSGYGRSFDNLSMIAELGHRVTLITWLPREGWCDDECVDEITSLGVEYVDKGQWNDIVQSRIGWYDIVIVSRPSTFQATYKEWQDFFKQSSFSLVYDAEALWFRRSESQHKVVQTQGIPFPSYDPETKPEVIELMLKSDQLTELSLVKMADTVVTVSNGELNQLNKQLPPGNYDIEVIGHVMIPVQDTEDSGNFKKRKGILFLASFSNQMHYNGDAIWHFLKYTYKDFVEWTKKPTPLTIAGRGMILLSLVNWTQTIDAYLDCACTTFTGIPNELRDFVKGKNFYLQPTRHKFDTTAHLSRPHPNCPASKAVRR
jgi:GT2 family glycosyltransferase